MINFKKYNLNKEIIKIKKTKYKTNQYLDWYSYRKILGELYNIRDINYLSARIYHAIFITEYEFDVQSAISHNKLVLCNRLSQIKYLEENGRKKNKTLAVGSLFSRYKDLKKIIKSPDAKGTIAYPSHRSRYTDTNIDWQKYCDELKKLPEEFHPINICMYWRDILENRHEIFLKNGFNVYSAGHCCNPDFVDNFYEILRHHKYATSNAIVATNLLYSIDFDIPTFIYGINESDKLDYSQQRMYGNSEEYFENYLNIHNEFYKNVIPFYPNIEISANNKLLVREKLGIDSITPDKKVIKSLKKEIFKEKFIKHLKNFFRIKQEKNKKNK